MGALELRHPEELLNVPLFGVLQCHSASVFSQCGYHNVNQFYDLIGLNKQTITFKPSL